MSLDENVKEIHDRIVSCAQCDLWKSRTQAVPGEGNVSADIMFIGEAPGFHEDRQGKPFVGRAGKIFDELLDSMKVKRDDVFIANILKCRPPKNRNPSSNEISTCTKFLDEQIACIDPHILVPMGNFASQYLFQKYSFPMESISKVHGKVFRANTLSGLRIIIPIFHPAVAVYNPSKIELLREDMSIIKKNLESIITVSHL